MTSGHMHLPQGGRGIAASTLWKFRRMSNSVMLFMFADMSMSLYLDIAGIILWINFRINIYNTCI